MSMVDVAPHCFERLPIAPDKPKKVCFRVSEFCDEHVRAAVSYGLLNCLRSSLESRIHLSLLCDSEVTLWCGSPNSRLRGLYAVRDRLNL